MSILARYAIPRPIRLDPLVVDLLLNRSGPWALFLTEPDFNADKTPLRNKIRIGTICL